jgi:hypothetical protein
MTNWELSNEATVMIGVDLGDDPSATAVKFYMWREQKPLPRFTDNGPDPVDLERTLVEVARRAGTPEEQAAVVAIIRRAFGQAADLIG